MTPSGSSATSSRVKTRRKLKPRRSHSLYKKKQNPKSNIKNEEIIISTGLPPSSCCCSSTSSNNDSAKILGDMDISDEEVNIDEGGCSTPKAQRFRIPEISTCPPAPKKPKALSNCSLHRSPIPFFTPPELELFFLVALRDISV